MMLHDLGFTGARASPQELQERLVADVQQADVNRPRDRESAECPSELQIEVAGTALSPNDPVLTFAEADEAAAFASEQGRRLDVDPRFAEEEPQPGSTPERRLVEHYIRRVDSRGSDVRLDLGHVFRSRPLHRTGVQTKRWVWNHVLSHRVKRKAHINSLELAAVGMAL